MSPFRDNNYVNPKILSLLLNRRLINLNEILLFPNRSNLTQKVNPISMRLHLNRSSDSSRFSDHYYGKFVYQDVNFKNYFGSIRQPTRKKPFGLRLGRCIFHHFPKRTFIHLFFPRRPPLKNKNRRRPRRRSRPRKRRWAVKKGESIGILSLRGNSTGKRRSLGAGKTVVRSMMRLDDRSRVIWRAKKRYEYHDRSPSYYSNKGWGLFLNPAVHPFFYYLVMQYLFSLENLLTKPVAREKRNLNHFVAFVVEGFTENLTVPVCVRQLGDARTCHLYIWYTFMRARYKSVEKKLRWRSDNIFMRARCKSVKKKLRWRSNNILREQGKLSLSKVERMIRGIKMILEIKRRRAEIERRKKERKRRMKERKRSWRWRRETRKESRWRRAIMYLNKVQKMRSLLSGRTNTNTFIGSVKTKSVYQSASLIAQDISFRLRGRRKSFRSIFYEPLRNIPLVMFKRVGGIRIRCSGRFKKKAEIARTECMEYGKTPRNTFRHRIDYASAKVSTRYGTLGVKVWISFL